jgi:protein disulfide-isomerase A6
LYSEALKIVAIAGSAAKHYVRVMEKLVNGSAGYIEKESKRYALYGLSPTCTSNANFYLFPSYRLEGILSKRNLSPAKLDELKIKVNILKSFVAEEPVAEEASKEAISREEAEL